VIIDRAILGAGDIRSGLVQGFHAPGVKRRILEIIRSGKMDQVSARLCDAAVPGIVETGRILHATDTLGGDSFAQVFDRSVA